MTYAGPQLALIWQLPTSYHSYQVLLQECDRCLSVGRRERGPGFCVKSPPVHEGFLGESPWLGVWESDVFEITGQLMVHWESALHSA